MVSAISPVKDLTFRRLPLEHQMTYSCIAIDDDPLFLKMLQVLISEIPELELLASYSNPIDGIMAAVKQKPNVLLIDYEMPYLDGFEALDTMDNLPKIIMISGYLEAYEVEDTELEISGFISKSDLRSPEVLREKVLLVMDQA